ncbi:MAG: EAL domain-containing protein [Alphaproteobacteria bacterium]|uniref:EAL domain-containing protein n=1 Tax=Candidatus Nitrobium versatile TaxID=2884831 RepID=A0A953M074_9BACT|nr:EAL domain-containing protein [Candidatus Nitrobium versatile]
MRDEKKTKRQLIEELAELRRRVGELGESESHMRETMRRQAYHDILTGLPNRILFMEHLALEILQAHRNRQMLAVLLIDLDRFKSVNDCMGHTAGDRLLQAVTYRLKDTLREGDIIARIGGDEYAVLLPQITREQDVVTIIKKIMKALRAPHMIDTYEIFLSASVGASLYPDDGENAETLVQNADTALYHAKEKGASSYQFYSPAMNMRAFKRIVLENSLRQTLESGGFIVYYQPQVNISTRQVTGIEALIRWNHPELGMLTPLHFIPLAEETGLIIPIGEWVLRAACEQNRLWQEEGFPPVTVTVNLSAHQFLQPDLEKMVQRVLRETSLDSKYLDLEITESTAMQNIDMTIPRLQRLSEMGVQLSIDDFGTGYSSLSYLKKLPVQKLKIDRSFISEVTTDSDDQAIVNAVIVMAHKMRLKVIAEGVETEEQLSFLHSSKCDEMQGYLFSKPLPAEELGKRLAGGEGLGTQQFP